MDKNFKVGIVVLLVLLQALMLSKVLMLGTSASIVVFAFFGIPLALLCAALILYKSHWPYLDMTLSMFSAGGLGMFIGYWVDLDNLGLYGPFGLMSLCRTASEMPLSFESLWFMFESTPWMYFGMFVGGNAGMFLFVRMQGVSKVNKLNQNQWFDYALCNIGMLLGMLSADLLSMAITEKLDLFWGNAVMIAFMLVGMMLGMFALLYLSTYIKKIFYLAHEKQQIA